MLRVEDVNEVPESLEEELIVLLTSFGPLGDGRLVHPFHVVNDSGACAVVPVTAGGDLKFCLRDQILALDVAGHGDRLLRRVVDAERHELCLEDPPGDSESQPQSSFMVGNTAFEEPLDVVASRRWPPGRIGRMFTEGESSRTGHGGSMRIASDMASG